MVEQVLDDLRRGDVRSLVHLDAPTLLAPVGLAPVAAQDGPTRHWTHRLQLAVDRLDDRRRAFALARFDELMERDQATAGLIRLLLPWSPVAQAELAQSAAEAFDRGRFARAIAELELLDHHDPRLPIAWALLGRHGRADLPMPLAGSAPGPLRATALLPGSRPPQPWAITGGRALCCPDAGPTRWQISLPTSARVHAGPAHLIIETEDGATVYDTAARTHRLAFATARPTIGVDRDHWWVWDEAGLARGRSLGDGTGALAIGLPERPTAPPLTLAPDQRLWLTPTWLVSETAGRLVARWRHELAAERWQLLRDGDAALLLGEDQTVLEVVGLEEALATASPVEAVALLLRAERPAAAHERIDAVPHPDRATALAAVLSRAPELGRPTDWQLLENLGAGALTAADAGARAGIEAARSLRQRLCTRHPAATWQRPGSAGSLLHQLHGRALATGATPDREASFLLQRHPDLGWVRRQGEQAFRIRGEAASTIVAAFRWADALPLWEHRWATPVALPSRSARWVDGRLAVFESQLRVHLLDPATGDRLATFLPDRSLGLAEAWLAITPHGAVVQDPSDPRHLWLLEPGTGADITDLHLPDLPIAARRAADGSWQVELQGGQVWTHAQAEDHP